MGVSEVFDSLSKLGSAIDLFSQLELFVGESDAKEHSDVVRLRFGEVPPDQPANVVVVHHFEFRSLLVGEFLPPGVVRLV